MKSITVSDFTKIYEWAVKYGLIALCAFIIAIPALINGYPFIFQDTPDYLYGLPRIYRPPIYGQFTQLGVYFDNIWLIIIAQNLIVAHLIYYINKVTYGNVRPLWMIAQSIILTVISSLPYFSSFVIADIFTPVMFLSFYLLLLHSDKLNIWLIIYFSALTVFSSMAHITNIYLGLGLLIFAAGFKLLRGRFRVASIKTVALPLGLVGMSAGILLTINFIAFNILSLSPGSSVFTLANFVAQGPAKLYLTKACPNADYKICKFVKSLPDDVNEFIWSSKGIVIKMNGFEGLREEAKHIVKNTVVAYPGDVAKNAFTYFIKSFNKHTPASEINNSVIKDRIIHHLARFFGPDETAKFMESAQAKNALPYDLIRGIDNIIYPLSMISIVILSIILWKKYNDNRYLLPLFTFIFIIGNNFLCAAASGLFDRYQARVSWLMLFAILITIGLMVQNRDNLKEKDAILNQ